MLFIQALSFSEYTNCLVIAREKSDQLLSYRKILKDGFSSNVPSSEERLNVLLMLGSNVAVLFCSDLLCLHYDGQDEGSGY